MFFTFEVHFLISYYHHNYLILNQCTRHGKILLMAGQLGLDPSTMVLRSNEANVQARRAFLNIEAVATANWKSAVNAALVFTIFVAERIDRFGRAQIEEELQRFLNGENCNIWAEMEQSIEEQDEGSDFEESLPNRTFTPLINWIVMPSLPKGYAIVDSLFSVLSSPVKPFISHRAAVEIAPILYYEPQSQMYEEESCEQTTSWHGAIQNSSSLVVLENHKIEEETKKSQLGCNKDLKEKSNPTISVQEESIFVAREFLRSHVSILRNSDELSGDLEDSYSLSRCVIESFNILTRRLRENDFEWNDIAVSF